MKLTDIEFADTAFKACVLATGAENAEEITVLRCRRQKIESAAGVEHLTNLKLLDLTRNEIESIDLAKNTRLEELFLGNNALSALDISGCGRLTHLEVFINELERLDVSHNPLLEEIYAEKNDLEAIDLSNNLELVDLRLSGNELGDIDLSVNTKLQRVDLEKNPLSATAQARVQAVMATQA